MKNSRLVSITVVALLWAVFGAYVCGTAPQLPDRVATHFGAGGEPNGWMTRASHMQFMLLFGLLVQAFVLGVFAVISSRHGRGLNIPHKAYWLAPERRAETLRFIQRQGAWFAALFLVFLGGIHHAILSANGRNPVVLPAAGIGWISVGFVVAMLVWVAFLIGHFFRRPA